MKTLTNIVKWISIVCFAICMPFLLIGLSNFTNIVDNQQVMTTAHVDEFVMYIGYGVLFFAVSFTSALVFVIFKIFENQTDNFKKLD